MRPFKMRFIGYCHGDWKENCPESEKFRHYHRVVGILLDVKSVMENDTASDAARTALAEGIAEALGKKNWP